ncbi:hypothetical protein VZT92_020579 [Zoarces viviparus]|uniref:Uncharacterized protein n=1 Tax=Zoarces viviparus TaxID=48416 RepID=A0AAW1EDV9_ZOAVI
MNAGREWKEKSQPHCRVTSGPVHTGASRRFWEKSSFLKKETSALLRLVLHCADGDVAFGWMTFDFHR